MKHRLNHNFFLSEMDRQGQDVERVLGALHQDRGRLQVREGREHRGLLQGHRMSGDDQALQGLQGSHHSCLNLSDCYVHESKRRSYHHVMYVPNTK